MDTLMRTMLTAMVVLLPMDAWAQHAGSVYVAGGVTVPYQSGATGESPQTYSAASGGFTLGFLAGGGVFVSPRVAIEGEWSQTGVMTSTQPSRYNETFNDRRRDRFLSVVARFPIGGDRIRIEPVGGVAWTFPEASTQRDRVPFVGAPIVEHEPPVEHHLNSHLGFTAGCDARIGGDRVAIVPSFRFSDTGVTSGRYSDDSPEREIESIYPGGYPRWTYRGAVAVRVGF